MEAFHGSTINIFGGEIKMDVEVEDDRVIFILFGGSFGTGVSLDSGISGFDNGMITLYGPGVCGKWCECRGRPP